jgi:FAD/FMN-containing dehydrogenase
VYLSDAKGDDDDYAVNNDRLQFLKDVEKILASIPGCLPHYGKFFTPGLYPFAKELPQWDRFLTLRKKLDPKDIFMNDYLADLLSSE